MDRRQKKSREAIFKAFIELVAKKHYNQITVGDIIKKADIGRATFYAHFETKDFLLKEFCEELFCHIFDSVEQRGAEHKHIFTCDAPSSVFLHLFQHLQNNDNNILKLLSCPNNDLFLACFKENLKELVKKQKAVLKKREGVPETLWVQYVCLAFVETVRWWIEGGMKETPEQIAEYFMNIA